MSEHFKSNNKLNLNLDSSRQAIISGPILISPGGTLKSGPNIDVNENQKEKSPLSVPMETEVFNSSPSQESKDTYPGFSKRDLFGGAITIRLPTSFEDVSTIRQVPDHQEVYADRDSDMSLIVELFDFEETVPNERAAKHYFDDLAKFNDAKEVIIESHELVADPNFMPNLKETYPRCALVGKQNIIKFNRPSPTATATVATTTTTPSSNTTTAVYDTVRIFLLVLRLPVVGTDLLITLNSPVNKSSNKNALSPATVMQTAIHSLDIINWSLFA